MTQPLLIVRRPLGAGVLFLTALHGCTAPGGPSSETPVKDASVGSDVPAMIRSALCLPTASEALPGRVVEPVEMAQSVSSKVTRTVFVTDLFGRFKNYCGACHVDNSIKGFHVDIGSFASIDRAKVLAAIKSDDPAHFMPPPEAQGKPWTERTRTPGDPVVALVGELEQWFAQNKPTDTFKVSEDAVVMNDSFAVPEEMAKRQTNLGNCVPEPGLVGLDGPSMDALDDMFAAATELPDKLSETDLSTLDSAVLARRGVVAFVPAYPLWSEDSGKMRAIRVPRGKSVRFDKTSQTFDIPPNTRFYKTFLKKVTDGNGRAIWRKIETRVIVARRDLEEDGHPAQVQALYGTYAWNEDETEAVLVRDPLRNGEPFGDRLFTYVVDERRYQQILDAKPRNLLFELSQEKNKGVTRHYAIPGKQRCLECHMGSPSKDFVLGFTPLQIRRRPAGEAGVYEETSPDELNQLQRLIDYGVITGIASPSEIRGLEEPQGTRTPRNQYELLAQAYLLGNCSHCHNPRGFPSVKSPDLVEALNFLPSDKGGIFRFPLNRVSPLRRRGVRQDVPIPYITPSLRDYPVGTAGDAKGDALRGLWSIKWADCTMGFVAMGFCNLFDTDLRFISAPWRSLLYRNVDTPYIYADDFAVFPHMPRHSAGFDCRAPRILGDWMVSIPALRKEEGAPYENSVRERPFDTTPQPYLDLDDPSLPEPVKPGDPRYSAAMAAASERLYEYHHGSRYDYCPDRSDIVVAEALTTTDQRKLTPPDAVQYADANKKVVVMPPDGVPDRAHWVPSDITETPGDWNPRRGDWKDVLSAPKDPGPNAPVADVPWVLRDLRIDENMKKYATKEIGFGVWKAKPGCDFTGVKKVRDYTGDLRMRWMDNPAAKVSPDAPVYTITPGGAVFANICMNCHGPQADSRGLLAEAISEMTGGSARVANFRDGLLGPADKVGANIKRVFGPIAAAGPAGVAFTDQDWAARYLSWMALGGTQRLIPDSLVKIVGATLVMGEPRKQTGEASANMLALASGICSNILGWQDSMKWNEYFQDGKPAWSEHTSLLDKSGDAEMWVRLCNVGNRPVVRVPIWDAQGKEWDYRKDELYWGDDYGKFPVMNDRGTIDRDGIAWNNFLPVCVRPDDFDAAPEGLRLHTTDGGLVPKCPPSLLETKPDANGIPAPIHRLPVLAATAGRNFVGIGQWSVRGAANAGVAVFLYLKDVRSGLIKPKPGYDHCELIGK